MPLSPGVKSAFGLLVSDLAYDYVATTIMPAAAADCTALDAAFARLEEHGRSDGDRAATTRAAAGCTCSKDPVMATHPRDSFLC